MNTELFTLPKPVLDKLIELNQIIEEHPVYIPLPVVASFLGAKPEGLRMSIEKGQCPFGVSWQRLGKVNKAYKIPTLTFYMWYTQGIGIKAAI